jgi:hypothetical protein
VAISAHASGDELAGAQQISESAHRW